MAKAINEEFTPTSGFTLVDEGFYKVSIFSVDTLQNKKNEDYYNIAYRIQVGEFDGEDVKDTYVGTTGKSLFKLHDILVGLGELEKYYDREKKRWFSLPEAEDLEGKKLQVRVDHEDFHSVRNGEAQYNVDGSPVMLTSAKVTGYFDKAADPGEFKPRARKAPPAPGEPGAAPKRSAAEIEKAAAVANTQLGGLSADEETPW